MAENSYKAERAQIIRFVTEGAEVIYESTIIRAVVALRRILVREGEE